MWLFDQNGFTSTVAYDPSKDMDKTSKHKAYAEASEDPKGFLLIRARIKDDLEQVGKKLGKDIMIQTDKSADYSFRALVSREDFKRYLAIQVDNLTYDSHFKEAARDGSTGSPGRYNAMLGVWHEMAALQPHKPYGGKTWSSGSTSYGSSYTKTLKFVEFSPSNFWTKVADLRDRVVGRSLSYFSPTLGLEDKNDKGEHDTGVLDPALIESASDDAFLTLLTLMQTADREERHVQAKIDTAKRDKTPLPEGHDSLLPDITEDEFDQIVTKVTENLPANA